MFTFSLPSAFLRHFLTTRIFFQSHMKNSKFAYSLLLFVLTMFSKSKLSFKSWYKFQDFKSTDNYLIRLKNLPNMQVKNEEFAASNKENKMTEENKTKQWSFIIPFSIVNLPFTGDDFPICRLVLAKSSNPPRLNHPGFNRIVTFYKDFKIIFSYLSLPNHFFLKIKCQERAIL